MNAFIGFFKQKSIIQLVGIIALCAMVWLAGPWVAIAGRTPLLPEFNRLLAILCIVAVWALHILFTQARARRADQQLIADLAAPEIDPAQEALAKAQGEEVSELRNKFEDALVRLKQARAVGKRDKRYLYELPWYVIIGAPGSGKTTALLNSGLKFPLSDRPGRKAVQGVGGTRNCDWFFADEAIFIDTAGRYTSQDSHQPVDEAAWKGFLELIKRHRPQRPINGVLVTMSMSDLLQSDEATRGRNAADIRQRIQELYAVLKVRFPVYMLFTKCDLVAGFTDFFADLRPEDRTQVWGETFTDGDSLPVEEKIFAFGTSFDELMKRLNQRSFRRIQDERDIQRRSLILDFPQQMALLKSSLLLFLSEAFSASRFDTEPMLRGVYFTSGTQEGTPIDRVLGRLADAYGFDRQRQPVFSGRGKAFFITRLLRDVVIPEADLTGIDSGIERRRRWRQRVVFGCVAMLVLGMSALWSISYIGNKRAIQRINQQIDRLQEAEKQPSPGGDPRGIGPLIARLDILKAAHDVYQGSPVWIHAGLYQGDKLQSEIDRTYRRMLTNELQPLIQSRLEQRLRAGSQTAISADPEVLYELLKSYLMLGQPDKLDPKRVGAVIAREWERSYSREPQLVSQLTDHTMVLLSERHWLDPIVLNTSLVASVRRKLNSIPLSMQIYAHLKGEAFSDPSSDFLLADHLGRYGDQVFDKQSIQPLTVPGLYTRDGYTTFFRMQGLGFVKSALAQNWVLENPAADQPGDLNRLYDDLERLYFAEYERRWRQLLDQLKLRRVRGINETIQVLDILSSPDTPIRPLLEAVQANTALTASLETEPDGGGAQGGKKNAGGSESDPRLALPSVPVPVPLRKMEQHFEDLNVLVEASDNAPPPLDHVLNRLAAIRDEIMMIGNSAKSEEQALTIARQRMSGTGTNDGIRLAKLEFDRLPEPLRTWFLSLTSFGWQFTLNSARSQLNSIWQQDVLAPYRSGLSNRYPLFSSSPYDATLTDFSRFFSPNGTIDAYFQEHIQPFVDTRQSRWRQVAMDNQSLDISNETLKQFQRAAKIRQTFFPTGGPSPSVAFELRPIALDQRIAVFRINMEGQTLEYSHGPIRSTRFEWPGPEADLGVRLTFQTHNGQEIYQSAEGPWALFRILDRSRVDKTNVPDRFRVTFQKNGYQARFELRASSADNPFELSALKQFRCPEGL